MVILQPLMDFGDVTKSKVTSFQRSKSLTADGIVGDNTWGKLFVTVKEGNKRNAVRAVQYLLKNRHGINVSIDGIFGATTKSAVKSFQSKKGITSDGIVGVNTWKYLIGTKTSDSTSNATISFASGIDSSVVSSYSKSVIKQMLANSGLKKATITSTIRTPAHQANIMYENCVANGAQSQLKLYASAGDQVINVYIAGKNAGYSKATILSNMTKKINNLWPTRVSLHCVPEAQYKKLNVIDIGASIGNKPAFVSQLKVLKVKVLSASLLMRQVQMDVITLKFPIN